MRIGQRKCGIMAAGDPQLEGKIAIVTGASRGIGAELARELHRRGARVVLVARSAEAVHAIAAETNGLAVVADVGRRDEVERVLAQAVERFGRVDVWVNNAGRGITKAPSQLTDDDVDTMLKAGATRIGASASVAIVKGTAKAPDANAKVRKLGGY